MKGMNRNDYFKQSDTANSYSYQGTDVSFLIHMALTHHQVFVRNVRIHRKRGMDLSAVTKDTLKVHRNLVVGRLHS